MVVCARCKEQEGTEIWADSTMDYVHGNYAMWCKRCVVVYQLEYARERAAAIPHLEATLKELDSLDNPC